MSNDDRNEEDPLEIDLVLAMLEARKPSDRLYLANDTRIKKLIASFTEQNKKEPKPEVPENVLFSDMVEKLNRKRKTQTRVLLVTSKAMYNLIRNNYKDCKRRIPITKLSGITLTENGDDFVLHVNQDYDYHYRSARRADIVRIIAMNFRELTGKDIPAQISDISNIKSLILTKSQLQLQTQTLGGNSGHNKYATNKIRALVSKKKVRYIQDGFDLDLTYIAPRLIAMGFPSEDNIEGLYRNQFSEVFRFLETRHADNYKVYNLCSERKYDSVKFHNRVGYYPFDDHHAPPLKTVVDMCTDMSAWLSEDPKHVIAVHCKAGKGRTGVLVSCFLLWSGLCSTAKAALEYFASKRTNDGKGVTIPSQIRSVHVFERLLKEFIGPGREFDYTGEPVVLTSIRIPRGAIAEHPEATVLLSIFNLQNERLYDSRSENRKPSYDATHITIPCSARLRGAVKFHFKMVGLPKIRFRFTLYTSFLEKNYLHLTKPEIDRACKDKKFLPRFQVELFFNHDEIYSADVKDDRAVAVPLTSPVKTVPKLEEAMKKLQLLESDNATKNNEIETMRAKMKLMQRELLSKAAQKTS